MNEIVKAVEKWIEKHPYLSEVASLPLACEEAVSDCESSMVLPDNLDSIVENFRDGMPLLHTGLDFNAVKSAGKILPYLSVLKDNEKLPEQVRLSAAGLEKLTDKDCEYLIESILKGNVEGLAEVSEKIDVAPDILFYFSWVSIRRALRGIKEELEKWIDSNLWRDEICPVCGSVPSSALLKRTKRGRQRFLHCDHCGTEWSYKRIGCPYCGNLDQKKMSIMDCEDEQDMRIDVCHVCNSYIKTYFGGDRFAIGADDWASIHLDLLMKDSGFVKKGSLIKAE